jgi:glutaconyl-CoA/methylmalonyl-CoA decarboxylase subunit gamma
MRKFIISITGEKFEVEVEEVSPDKVYSSSKANGTRMGEYNQNVKGSLIPRKAEVVNVDSPMPGNIIRILVNPGDEVSTGQKLFVLESMKMENEIGASASGRVAGIKVNVGDAVTAGQSIIVLE